MRTQIAACAAGALLLAACSGSPDGTGTSSTGAPGTPGTAATATSAAPSTTSAPTGAAPTTGPALADAVTRASTGQYTVSSTVTGDQPLDVTGRGDLAARTLAVRLPAGADHAQQDVEVVGGTAYTTLDGVTTGRQRVAVHLGDPDDQLVDAVAPLVAATDLTRVVQALRSATRVTRSGDTVTAVVPSRALASLFGVPLDGTVPASAPVTVGLDPAGRVRTVSARLGQATRTSTYGGWAPGPAIVAPAKGDLVDSPL